MSPEIRKMNEVHAAMTVTSAQRILNRLPCQIDARCSAMPAYGAISNENH